MPVGRPRAFDIDAALDRAIGVFWRQGYEGAALSDLTAAMGVNRPSLYAAYGNKEQLFTKALDRYAESEAAFTRDALDLPTAREVATRLLVGGVETATQPGKPHGCVTIQSALAASPAAEGIRLAVAARRSRFEDDIRRRLVRARDEGDLPADASPAELAKFVNTVFQGLAVQAAGGATREELLHIVSLAMRAWPTH